MLYSYKLNSMCLYVVFDRFELFMSLNEYVMINTNANTYILNIPIYFHGQFQLSITIYENLILSIGITVIIHH